MGPGQKFLTLVGSGHFLMLSTSGNISPKNPNFSIFSPSGQKKLHQVTLKNTRVKGGLATYLLWVKSMLG